jgi:hypothetical protein
VHNLGVANSVHAPVADLALPDQLGERLGRRRNVVQIQYLPVDLSTRAHRMVE